MGQSLNDLEGDKSKFDQFEGRQTSYKESIYNTTYDLKNFSKEQIDHAIKLGKEIESAPTHGNLHLA